MKKSRRILFLAFLLLVGLAMSTHALAAEVVFDNDTTVTVSGNDYVILAGSEADSVEVGASTVTVSVPSGSTFTFQSPDRHILGNNGAIAQSCTAEDNRLIIQGPKTSLVITPAPGGQCGLGIGSFVWSPEPSPAEESPSEAPAEQPEEEPGQEEALDPAPPGAPAPLTGEQVDAILNLLRSFGADSMVIYNVAAILRPADATLRSIERDLQLGSSGEDVRLLQQLLNQDPDTRVAQAGPGSPGSETTFFGALTRGAVIRFQEKYVAEILHPIGLTAGTGFVGPATSMKLNLLFAQ